MSGRCSGSDRSRTSAPVASITPRGAGGTSWELLDSLAGDAGDDGSQPCRADHAQAEWLDHLQPADPLALEAGLGAGEQPAPDVEGATTGVPREREVPVGDQVAEHREDRAQEQEDEQEPHHRDGDRNGEREVLDPADDVDVRRRSARRGHRRTVRGPRAGRPRSRCPRTSTARSGPTGGRSRAGPRPPGLRVPSASLDSSEGVWTRCNSAARISRAWSSGSPSRTNFSVSDLPALAVPISTLASPSTRWIGEEVSSTARTRSSGAVSTFLLSSPRWSSTCVGVIR